MQAGRAGRCTRPALNRRPGAPARTSGLFLAATGQWPLAWLEQARLQHARSLLATTGLPVKLVAAACGYTDQRHFATRFSRQFGSTPGQFRRQK